MSDSFRVSSLLVLACVFLPCHQFGRYAVNNRPDVREVERVDRETLRQSGIVNQALYSETGLSMLRLPTEIRARTNLGGRSQHSV
ncbi:hypothetical protein BDW59DRAFT_144154 [Aspergillus cavernicola]|uniref:Uncharacterized protein n=1 Tax=Aspergillus cavernicola TaxID=176166 RepID=A0ABR4IJG2_9EURO